MQHFGVRGFSIYENAPHMLCFGSWGLNAVADQKI